MAEMSERNLAAARGYSRSELEQRRTRFYRHVRQATEAWLASREGR
jgi:hypothetical protein